MTAWELSKSLEASHGYETSIPQLPDVASCSKPQIRALHHCPEYERQLLDGEI
jgi:hypothetical protein